MRPRTADRRSSRRLLLTVVAVAVVGALGVLAIGYVNTNEEMVVAFAVEIIAVVGVLAWYQRGERRDRARVDVYINRLLDMDDDPEIDPRTDV